MKKTHSITLSVTVDGVATDVPCQLEASMAAVRVIEEKQGIFKRITERDFRLIDLALIFWACLKSPKDEFSLKEIEEALFGLGYLEALNIMTPLISDLFGGEEKKSTKRPPKKQQQ